MKEQYPTDADSPSKNSDELLTNEASADGEPNASESSTIYKKDSINPAKRRRLEALREERELMNDLKEVFDDY